MTHPRAESFSHSGAGALRRIDGEPAECCSCWVFQWRDSALEKAHTNLREVADRHPGVRREREARKRGPRHRFWRSAAAAGAAAAAGDGHSAWEGSQKLKIGAA